MQPKKSKPHPDKGRFAQVVGLWIPILIPACVWFLIRDLDRLLMVAFGNGSLFVPMAVICLSLALFPLSRQSEKQVAWILAGVAFASFHLLYLVANFFEQPRLGLPDEILEQQHLASWYETLPVIHLEQWQIILSIAVYTIGASLYTFVWSDKRDRPPPEVAVKTK